MVPRPFDPYSVPMLAELPSVTAHSRAEWRAWLHAHHADAPGVLLVYFKKGSGIPSVSYPEAVQEALCFGWIDTTRRALDEARFSQLFVPRKPKSGWSRLNKSYVEALTRDGLMAPAGLAVVEAARLSGAWDRQEAGESRVVPEDLAAALAASPQAQAHFAAFPASIRKYILQWIHEAKRPDTRAKRIEETVRLAEQNIRVRGARPSG